MSSVPSLATGTIWSTSSACVYLPALRHGWHRWRSRCITLSRSLRHGLPPLPWPQRLTWCPTGSAPRAAARPLHRGRCSTGRRQPDAPARQRSGSWPPLPDPQRRSWRQPPLRVLDDVDRVRKLLPIILNLSDVVPFSLDDVIPAPFGQGSRKLIRRCLDPAFRLAHLPPRRE